ncbi:MAG: hypothetical protein LBG09_02990 [Puniceicoccales bacterium]|jgi:hypothetical protein|nr:hypothetical protein [Puniceicoccales bacterium]
MSPVDKDKRLLELFQLKKQLERPDRAFWERFDEQLRRKFLRRTEKISLREKWHDLVRKYGACVHSLVYAAVVCCVLLLGVAQLRSPKTVAPTILPEQFTAAVDVIPFQRAWADATLVFDDLREERAYYICNDMRISGLNSRAKELIF